MLFHARQIVTTTTIHPSHRRLDAPSSSLAAVTNFISHPTTLYPCKINDATYSNRQDAVRLLTPSTPPQPSFTQGGYTRSLNRLETVVYQALSATFTGPRHLSASLVWSRAIRPEVKARIAMYHPFIAHHGRGRPKPCCAGQDWDVCFGEGQIMMCLPLVESQGMMECELPGW
jgi:hypothetical protein